MDYMGFRDITPIMESPMDTEMEDDMESEVLIS